MSNITVTHAESGLVRADVVRTERVSPHVQRVTLAGGTLDTLTYKGFDQWFRLAISVHDGDRFDKLPERFGLVGALKYMALPKDTRPVIRNYTIREFRENPRELDIDFIVHGTDGIAAPWSTTVEAGVSVGLIDQGCGWEPVVADRVVIVSDETGMPAVLGILRDMPRDSHGDAIIELFDERDKQAVDAPAGMRVHWVVRDAAARPGDTAMAALREVNIEGSVYAFAVGESSLATGARRYLVQERGVPKSNVTFSGYWKLGRTAA